MLPPFFWKGVSDDGLFAWYATLIERVGDPRLKLMLYHLPQVSAVPLSVDLVARLAAAFPGVVAGVKDSEGNWAHTSALLARVPRTRDRDRPRAAPAAPHARRRRGHDLRRGQRARRDSCARCSHPPSPRRTRRASPPFIEVTGRHPFLVSFKSLLADRLRDPGWLPVRAPLTGLDAAQRAALREALAAAGLAPQQAEAAQ